VDEPVDGSRARSIYVRVSFEIMIVMFKINEGIQDLAKRR